MYREGRKNNEVLKNHVARLWLAPAVAEAKFGCPWRRVWQYLAATNTTLPQCAGRWTFVCPCNSNG
jgi:hypothetical protein